MLLENGLDVGEVVLGRGSFRRHLTLGRAPGFCSSARGLPAFETLADDEQDTGERQRDNSEPGQWAEGDPGEEADDADGGCTHEQEANSRLL